MISVEYDEKIIDYLARILFRVYAAAPGQHDETEDREVAWAELSDTDRTIWQNVATLALKEVPKLVETEPAE